MITVRESGPICSVIIWKRRTITKWFVTGNALVEDYPDLIVKQHYWTWPAREIHGNAIDFLVLVEGKSFHQAMQILTAHTGGEGLQKKQEMPIPVAASLDYTTTMGTNYDRSAGITQK